MREKQARLVFHGKEHRLLYNVAAMDEIRNRYGSVSAFIELGKKALEDGNVEEFARVDLPWVTMLLFNQSIDLDNFENGAQKEYYDDEYERWLRRACENPDICANLFDAVIDAVVLGNDGAPKDDDGEDVDEVLLEIEQKKGIDRSASSMELLFMGLQCGLGERQAWLTTPGRIAALWRRKQDYDFFLHGIARKGRWID